MCNIFVIKITISIIASFPLQTSFKSFILCRAYLKIDMGSSMFPVICMYGIDLKIYMILIWWWLISFWLELSNLGRLLFHSISSTPFTSTSSHCRSNRINNLFFSLHFAASFTSILLPNQRKISLFYYSLWITWNFYWGRFRYYHVFSIQNTQNESLTGNIGYTKIQYSIVAKSCATTNVPVFFFILLHRMKFTSQIYCCI